MQFEYLAYDLLIKRISNKNKTLFIYWLFKVPIRERLWKNFHLVYAFWWIIFITNMMHFLICISLELAMTNTQPIETIGE
jgi:hypothetical protein